MTAIDALTATAARLEFIHQGRVINDTFYNPDSVALISGNVQVDREADSRRTMNCELLILEDRGLELTDPVARVEIKAYTSTDIPNAWRPQGVFHPTRRSLKSDANLATANLTCVDRSDKIRMNPFPKVYSIPKDTNYITALEALVTDRASGFTPEFNSVPYTATLTPTLVFEEDEDPWAAVLKLAEGAASECYFDQDGVLVTRPIPDARTLPIVAQIIDGEGGASVGEISVETDMAEVYNGVICRSEAPWLLFPVHAEIWDEDPMSLTYMPLWGKKPKKIGDAIAGTTAQCLAIATAEFNKVAGVLETVNFGLTPDINIAEGQVVMVYQPKLGLTIRTITEKLTIPLGGGEPITGMVRRRR